MPNYRIDFVVAKSKWKAKDSAEHVGAAKAKNVSIEIRKYVNSFAQSLYHVFFIDSKNYPPFLLFSNK